MKCHFLSRGTGKHAYPVQMFLSHHSFSYQCAVPYEIRDNCTPKGSTKTGDFAKSRH